MAKEIEFKHKANYIPSGIKQHLRQGYILISKEKQVRVRVNLNQHTAHMCVKFMDGAIRDEFETEMDFTEGLHLYSLCEWRVAKTRLSLRAGRYHYDFDEYEDGTKIVEIEVSPEDVERYYDDLDEGNLMDFVGESVDGKWEYNNYHFAGFPESEYK